MTHLHADLPEIFGDLGVGLRETGTGSKKGLPFFKKNNTNTDFFFFFFLVTPDGLQDLRFLTRD